MEMNHIDPNLSVEDIYSNNTPSSHRKKYAQFFTPSQIAELMAKWILGNPHLNTVLEPAIGLGIFSRILLSHNKLLYIKGFDIDSNILQYAANLFCKYPNVSLLQSNYIYADWESKYDGIICNPPYFKFHDYDNKSVLSEINQKLNLNLNGFTNLYSLFLLKSLSQLNINGRVAYLIPSEFLNSDYGVRVKEELLKSKTLRHIIVFNSEVNLFPDSLSTSCIFLCSNDFNQEFVNFTCISSLKDLKKIEDLILIYPNVNKSESFLTSALDPKIKWRQYYDTQKELTFRNLVPFSNFARVIRGIATGSNNFFVFSESKIKEYSISEKHLLPCICKSADVKNVFFMKQDFDLLKKNDKSIFLFNAIDKLDSSARSYILKGESEMVNKKYLTSKRNPWYSLEKRLPAPIWVSVFHRNGARFIRNEANISNLTTFHGIYPIRPEHAPVNIDLFFAYLLTDVAKLIFEKNRREYGNGLNKFEPNDLNNSQMLDLTIIDKKSESDILENYFLYRDSIISGNPNNQYLHDINSTFLNYLV